MDTLANSTNTHQQSVVIVGGGTVANVVSRKMLAPNVDLTVFAPSPSVQIEDLAQSGRISLHRQKLTVEAASSKALIIAASSDPAENSATEVIAALAGTQAHTWEEFSSATGHVDFVGSGPGDPDLLTLKALRAIQTADILIYDRLVSQPILDLAGPKTLSINAGKEGFGPSMAQEEINDLIVDHALQGSYVVRLKSGDATVFGRLDEEIDAVDAFLVPWTIVPGITSASAAVAAIGQSLTKRRRNASVRFLTGHDMQGFADHDWTSMARAGEVAAIYMGKKSARFIQGRLLMHGADRHTPVTVVENASRPDQRVIGTTLDALPQALQAADLSGPALTFFGLAPRDAALPSLVNQAPSFTAPISTQTQEAL